MGRRSGQYAWALVVAIVAAAAPARAADLGSLVRDPADGAALVTRDGALFAGDTTGVRVVGRDTAEANVRAAAAHAARAPFADVAWESAPRIGARARLAVDPQAGAIVVATVGDAPFAIVTPRGAVLAADLDDPSNAPLRRWGYLPYVLHAAAAHAAGRDPGRFADWPYAPVPHRRLASIWLAVVALLAVALTAAFLVARRAARRHPDAHVAFFARLATPSTPESAGWTRPGIARPLGGFFMFISATLLAMGPYLYVTAILVPSRVQPFPDADGAWAPIEEINRLAWIVAEFGVTTAFVRFFAAHRVDNPARALKAAQLWIWWQIAVYFMLFLVGGALACHVLPRTHLALFAQVVLLCALIQKDSVLSFFTNFFQAAQRFDFYFILDLLEQRLLYVVCPIPFILWLRAVGRAHPALGETFGAIAGIAAGQWCAVLLTCFIGWTLYRRLRLPLAPVLYAGFDRATFAEMARFGAGVVLGKAPFFAANAIELVIIAALLPGYVTWLGIRNLLMQRLVFTIWFVWPFIDSAIPAISEALAAAKQALVRYYVIRYLQFGHLFVALVIAVLLGAGRPLVLYALSAEWRPVATYLPLACASAVFLPAAWLVDAFLKGAGRATLDAAILIGEQLVRVVLFWVCIPRLGFAGIFVAIIISIALKTVVGWTVAHRRVVRLVAWPWSTTLAPLCAGAIVYILLVVAAALLPATKTAAIALFAVAALATFPLGFLVVGAIGGLDPAAVEDLRRAAELASAMRPIARVLARAGALGARLMPRRLPPLAAEAQREADAIVTAERPAPGAPP